MDQSTVLGLVLAMLFTGGSIIMSGDMGAFIDIPSILIVVGGTIASTMIAFPMSEIKNVGKLFQKAFFYEEVEPKEVIQNVIELANIARKDGLLALEEHGLESEDKFMKKSIMLIVDGTDPELVRSILETELTFLEDRHSQGQSLVQTMGTYAPAFGMIGTLIGLVNLLKELDDPDMIGPNMSVALVTTFYGSFLANVVFLPLAQKLKVRSESEILIKELILEGLLSIQAGENPRIIEEKLKTFIPPRIREKMEEEG